MSDYFLGSGNKKPKRADYMREFGWQGDMFYRLDAIKYSQKQQAKKEYKENLKKQAEHFKNSTWF